MCPSQVAFDCRFDDLQVHGGQGINELTDLVVDEKLPSHLTAEIPHNPDDCTNKDKCYYMFSISNGGIWESSVYSMMIQLEFYDPGNVVLEKRYKNIVQYGEYIRHEISELSNPDMIHLKSLKIKLTTYQGDADLFVSFWHPNPS
jgi:hypothetical protein